MSTQYRIRSFSDLEYISNNRECILTLFSGGVDSSYVLMELAKHKACQIIALTVDLGDGVNRNDLKRIAYHFGARSVVIDGRDIFAQTAVLQALRCNAQYMAMYPISSSLSRPIICHIAVKQAATLECTSIVHTANQSQNSLRRLNGSLNDLRFNGFYGSPYEYSVLTRQEKLTHYVIRGSLRSRREVSAETQTFGIESSSRGFLKIRKIFVSPMNYLPGLPDRRLPRDKARFRSSSWKELRWRSMISSFH